MSAGSGDIYGWLRDVTARSVADIQRYQNLVQRVLRGEISEQHFREGCLSFAREKTDGYLRALGQLSLNYYSSLHELGRAYADQFFQVLHGEPERGRTEPDRQPRRIELPLHGPVNKEARASFTIENKRSEPADISFLLSEFTEVGGGFAFRPRLEFEPPHPILGPLEETVVGIRLALEPQFFQLDHRYTATVVVRGFDSLEIVLSVMVDPPGSVEESPEPTAAVDQAGHAAAPPPRRRRKRKTAASARVSRPNAKLMA